MKQFTYTDQHGKPWYLNMLTVALRNGGTQELPYFAATPGKHIERSKPLPDLPAGLEVKQRLRGYGPPRLRELR